jgi:hypothetical protein
MHRYSLKHLSNEVLRRELSTAAARERGATADLLAHIAEFDARKLYLPAGYDSTYAYCVGELRLSEHAAGKRIHAARAALECPAVFEALADGRVHLSAVVLLAPHLSPQNADELLAAATHQSKSAIEQLLAERFPKLSVASEVRPLQPQVVANAESEHAPGRVGMTGSFDGDGSQGNCHAGVAPLSAEAFAVQFTRSREADERFRYLQDLLGHAVSRGDLAEVYDRAVKELIARMERVRFGACERPRAKGKSAKSGSRHIPAQVKRAVWQRDGGQCTFVGDTGHRCEARGDVEFDHTTEVARGGEATIDNLRLRCRGHNQYTAGQTFGEGFMQGKREAAAEARAAAKAKAAKAKAEKAEQAEQAKLQPHELEVIPWLRTLGLRDQDCRIAVRRCRDMADAPINARMKRALSWFGERCSRTERPAAPALAGPDV